jgi:hypothetical protein
MSKKTFLILLFSALFTTGFSQKNGKKYSIRTIAFYNVENLFDTINDVTKNDEASPIMELKLNRSKVYWDKIDKLSSTIAKIGLDKTNTSPAIIGVSEVENIKVLEDLIASKHLAKNEYGIIHYDSPDKRGIDVALLYQKKYFNPIYHEAFHPKIYQRKSCNFYQRSTFGFRVFRRRTYSSNCKSLAFKKRRRSSQQTFQRKSSLSKHTNYRKNKGPRCKC